MSAEELAERLRNHLLFDGCGCPVMRCTYAEALIAQRDALLVQEAKQSVLDVALIAHDEQQARIASLESQLDAILAEIIRIDPNDESTILACKASAPIADVVINWLRRKVKGA